MEPYPDPPELPVPIHRQVPRQDAWGRQFNLVSLAQAVLRADGDLNVATPRFAWAQRMLKAHGLPTHDV